MIVNTKHDVAARMAHPCRTNRGICGILLLFVVSFTWLRVGYCGEQDAPEGQSAKAAEATADKSASESPNVKSAPAPAASRDAPKMVPAISASKGAVWLSTLAQGQPRAAAEGKPLLIRLITAWNPACRKLTAELEKSEVQAELARWVLVSIDIDQSPDDAARLNAVVVPGLRIRAPGGQLISARDGVIPSEELLAWLKKQYDVAMAAPEEALLRRGEPETEDMFRVIRQFGDRSPAVREAAVRRLMAYPEAAAESVVKAFSEGNLAVRLTALELLREWNAPIADFDPWQAETFTPENVLRLQNWAEKSSDISLESPDKPTPEKLGKADSQIERMLKGSDEEADAILQRLARFGPALLPRVYELLKTAASDRDRHRLLLLRYRLATNDSLALRWPGGLLRLASADPRQRQQAAEELAQRATAEDHRLLLELFSDPDPLVRENCLRGLQNIGGDEAMASLVDLLADPEPNVRAAVLKQLESNPQADMVPKIAEYLKTEKDPDLIVHAIRFLRAARGIKAAKSLVALLKHESWQVRSEAAAAINDTLERSSFRSEGNAAETGAMADAYMAVIDLLDDPDGFVVSRAVEVLSKANLEQLAVEPLIQAAEKHPDLAKDIIRMLVANDLMKVRALPSLRKFCKHSDPAIRAAAVAGVVAASPDNAGDEIAAALSDGNSAVRTAAAAGIFSVLERSRESAWSSIQERNRRNTFPNVNVDSLDASPEGILAKMLKSLVGSGAKKDAPPAGDAESATDGEKPAAENQTVENNAPSKEEEPWDRWLKAFYGGKGQPDWAQGSVAPLEKMLAAESIEEKATAAMVLVPLGKADRTLPILLDMARTDDKVFTSAATVLPWLAWDEREKTFQTLRGLAANESKAKRLLQSMLEIPDRRAIGLFWDILSEDKLSLEMASDAAACIMQLYQADSSESRPGTKPPYAKQLLAAAEPRMASGGELQRLAALSVLANLWPEEGMKHARNMADDATLGEEIRRDAFQIMLVFQPDKKAAIQTATAALAGDDPQRKKIALLLLTADVGYSSELQIVRKSLYLRRSFDDYDTYGRRSGEPIVPKPPAGLEVKHVKPLLTDKEPGVVAHAGYLLALLGDSDGMDALVAYWRAQPREAGAQRLVYRAAAALDDEKYVPVLREIYGNISGDSRISDFYWTIRIMSGPEILTLRKEIRDKVGMSRLQ
jgi:hypothetical protein